MRFRPNLVVAGGLPFEEEGWSEIATGSAVFKVTHGFAHVCMAGKYTHTHTHTHTHTTSFEGDWTLWSLPNDMCGPEYRQEKHRAPTSTALLQGQ